MEDMFLNLTKLIEAHPSVIFMTHKNPDLDGLGSALALSSIATQMGKQNAVVIASAEEEMEKNSSILKTLTKIKEAGFHINLIEEQNIIKKFGITPLLVVLDTHKNSMVESEQLLQKIANIAVIDHHIKHPDYIKNTVFSYINANMSSTVEIVTSYLSYLKMTIPPLLATIMLAGLEIDTNNFNLKTTDKTYEAAALLTKMGADQISKQELLKENKEEYVRRHRFIESSFMIRSNMAMCMMDDNIYVAKDLATISEELLQLENIEASFTIGKLADHIIGISARSIGNIDVEAIMAALGGGGHMTEAAAQIEASSINEVREKIMKVIGE